MMNSQRVVTSSNASSGACSVHAPAVSSRHLPRYKVHSECSQLNSNSCWLWCPVKHGTEPDIESPGHSSEEKYSVWYELIHTRMHTDKRNHHRGLWWFCYFDLPEREVKRKMVWPITLWKLPTALHRGKPFIWVREVGVKVKLVF